MVWSRVEGLCFNQSDEMGWDRIGPDGNKGLRRQWYGRNVVEMERERKKRGAARRDGESCAIAAATGASLDCSMMMRLMQTRREERGGDAGRGARRGASRLWRYRERLSLSLRLN